MLIRMECDSFIAPATAELEGGRNLNAEGRMIRCVTSST